MADKKISQLPSGGAIQNGDLIPIARGATNYSVAGSVVTSKQDALTAANFGSFSTALTAKTTPVDADTINLTDSAESNIAKKLSWVNIKTTLKAYFDTLYLSLTGGTMTGNLSVPKISVGTTNTPSIETVGEGLTTGASLAGVTQTTRRTTSRIGNAEINFNVNHLHSATSWIKNLFVRSKGDTDTHVSVASGDIIEESIYGGRFQSGGTGSYYPAVSIKKKIGTGTVSGTSMPGELSIEVSPDGAVVPVEAFKINSDGSADFRGVIRPKTVESTLTGNLTIAKGDGQIFNIDPNGANRDVTLWASPTVGDQIQIRNSGTGGFILTVKNSAGTAITRAVVANNVTIVLTYYSAGWAV